MAITYDGFIAAASDTSGSAQTLAITVPAGGVAAGELLVIGAGWKDSSRNLASIADTKGNTYRVDIASGPSSGNISWCGLAVCYVTVALVSGNTITLTFSGAGGVGPAMVARADTFGGFVGIPVLDRSTAHDAGSTSAPSSGNMAATTNAADLLIGVFGAGLGGTNTMVAGAGYTAMGASNAGAGAALVFLEYQIVSSTGVYAATATDSTGSQQFQAGVAAYQTLGGGATPPAFTVPPLPGARIPNFLLPGARTRAEGQLSELSAQQSHPSFDTIVTTWTRGGNDSGSLYGQVDENAPGNDADYITSVSA